MDFVLRQPFYPGCYEMSENSVPIVHFRGKGENTRELFVDVFNGFGFVVGKRVLRFHSFLSDDVIPMTSSVNAGKRKSDGIFGVTM